MKWNKEKIDGIRSAGDLLSAVKGSPEFDDLIQGELYRLCYRGSLPEFLMENDFHQLLGGAGETLQALSDIPQHAVASPLPLISGQIGLGTYGWKHDPNIIAQADAQGAYLIDTAPTYGFGKVERDIRKGLGFSPDILIATKFPKNRQTYGNIMASFERSRSNFPSGTGIHYQIHWPNKKFPLRDVVNTMGNLLKDKKVESIGICNFSVSLLRLAQHYLHPQYFITNQVRYNLFDRKAERYLTPYCKSNRITLIAYSPLGQNLRKTLKEKDPKGVLTYFGRIYQATPAQILLAWLLSKPGILPIFSTNNLYHLNENFDSRNLKLDPKDIEELEAKFWVD